MKDMKQMPKQMPKGMKKEMPMKDSGKSPNCIKMMEDMKKMMK